MDAPESTLAFRKCKECGQEKPLIKENFRPHTVKGKIYFEYECRKCGNARSLQWYRENLEHAQAVGRARYKANVEKYRQEGRDDYRRNRSARRAQAAKRRRENLELVRAQDREIAKRWRAAHPFEASEWARVQRARKRAAKTAPVTQQQIEKLFESQKGRCAICKRKIAMNAKHIDHINPLSKGGEHNIKNLQLTCAICNLQKRGDDPILFMQKRGFLL
jgi:5-methylcytosine-specific restriction endonuclease McrA